MRRKSERNSSKVSTPSAHVTEITWINKEVNSQENQEAKQLIYAGINEENANRFWSLF